jgi:hypothetical protein
MINDKHDHSSGSRIYQALNNYWSRFDWHSALPIIIALSALVVYYYLLFVGWAWLIFVIFGLMYPVYCMLGIANALLKGKTGAISVCCIAILISSGISLFGDQLLHVRLFIYFLMHEQAYESELNTIIGSSKQKKWHVANRDGNEGYYIIFDKSSKIELMQSDQTVCRDRVLN